MRQEATYSQQPVLGTADHGETSPAMTNAIPKPGDGEFCKVVETLSLYGWEDSVRFFSCAAKVAALELHRRHRAEQGERLEVITDSSIVDAHLGFGEATYADLSTRDLMEQRAQLQ
ncbi:MAG: hypothetical protein KTV16_01865 [Acidimicrobiia bacterium]|nr:hypothetical protein [Acidimicrobiia bacterium]